MKMIVLPFLSSPNEQTSHYEHRIRADVVGPPLSARNARGLSRGRDDITISADFEKAKNVMIWRHWSHSQLAEMLSDLWTPADPRDLQIFVSNFECDLKFRALIPD
jgi:hypothetical protein